MQIPLRISFNYDFDNEKAWNEVLSLLKNLIKEGTAVKISKDVANDVIVEFKANPEWIRFGECEE